MENLITELIRVSLFSYEEATGKKGAFSLEEMKVFEIIESTENTYTLKDIVEPIFELEIDKNTSLTLLELNNINESSKFELFSSKISELNRAVIGRSSGGHRAVIGQSSDGHRAEILENDKIIGSNNYTFERVSQDFKGATALKLKEIEDKISIILNQTNKRKTLLKTTEDYKLAVEFSQKGGTDHLVKLAAISNRLSTRIVRQGGVAKTQIIQAERKEPTKKMYTFFGTFVLVLIISSLLYLVVFRSFNSEKNEVEIQTEQVEKIENKKTFSKSELESLISTYEKENDTIITAWRKTMLINYFPTSEMTEKEVIKSIKERSNINYKFY